jgi:hypothetical protein
LKISGTAGRSVGWAATFAAGVVTGLGLLLAAEVVLAASDGDAAGSALAVGAELDAVGTLAPEEALRDGLADRFAARLVPGRTSPASRPSVAKAETSG